MGQIYKELTVDSNNPAQTLINFASVLLTSLRKDAVRLDAAPIQMQILKTWFNP